MSSPRSPQEVVSGDRREPCSNQEIRTRDKLGSIDVEEKDIDNLAKGSSSVTLLNLNTPHVFMQKAVWSRQVGVCSSDILIKLPSLTGMVSCFPSFSFLQLSSVSMPCLSGKCAQVEIQQVAFRQQQKSHLREDGERRSVVHIHVHFCHHSANYTTTASSWQIAYPDFTTDLFPDILQMVVEKHSDRFCECRLWSHGTQLDLNSLKIV